MAAFDTELFLLIHFHVGSLSDMVDIHPKLNFIPNVAGVIEAAAVVINSIQFISSTDHYA
jgi:hypothetical protein